MAVASAAAWQHSGRSGDSVQYLPWLGSRVWEKGLGFRV